MSDANCRYCTWLVPADSDEPGTKWEPLVWACSFGWTVRVGWHDCGDFEREPGSDDDLEVGDEG